MSNTELHVKLLMELHSEYPDIPKKELDKIIDSEFRLIEKLVTTKQCKVINSIFLGKWYPTKFRYKLEEQSKLKLKEDECSG